jgi:hypothetical protein
MYGLVIAATGDKSDLIKVASTKEKLFEVVVNEIKNYISENKKISRIPEVKFLMEAIQLGEIEAAMEIFGNIAEQNGNPMFMAIADAEIIYDA